MFHRSSPSFIIIGGVSGRINWRILEIDGYVKRIVNDVCPTLALPGHVFFVIKSAKFAMNVARFEKTAEPLTLYLVYNSSSKFLSIIAY